MKCSSFTGVLLKEPTVYREVDGETLYMSSLSIRGKEYGIVGYDTAFIQAVGELVVATGYVVTFRVKGKLQTFFKVLKMEKAETGVEENSALEVEGILTQRDQTLSVEESSAVERLVGIVQYQDAGSQYSIVHFVCKGKQARQMLKIEKDSKVILKGILLKRASVYELLVKEIETL